MHNLSRTKSKLTKTIIFQYLTTKIYKIRILRIVITVIEDSFSPLLRVTTKQTLTPMFRSSLR